MRIAAYCRVSTERDEQIESLNNQKQFFEDFACSHNHILTAIYADEGISGKQCGQRAQFRAMLEDAKHNLFDMVVVKDISRFARNTVDFLTAVRELKGRGIEVMFISNNQTVLGGSEFILTIFGALAQEESANLSKRVKFGKRVNAKKGRVPNLLYGYDRVNNFTLAVNEEEAEVVRRIFDMYLYSGFGTRKIAQILNETKTPSKKGLLWGAKTIRRLLANPIYSGVLINNKTETVDFLTGEKHTLPEEESFVHQRPELAIISKEHFSAAQEQMRQRREKFSSERERHSNVHTLSTLIKCGSCGYSFFRRANGRWRCSGNNAQFTGFCTNSVVIDEGELLGNIKEYLMGIVEDKHAFTRRVENGLKRQKTINSAGKNRLEKQAERLANSKERYKIMFANGIIGLDELLAQCGEIDKQLKKISDETENQKLEGKNNNRELCFDELFCLEEYTNTQIKKIIDSITVMPDGEVRIEFKMIE